MEVTKEKKDKIERDIVEMSVSALEAGNITENDLGDISTFVLSWIDKIEDTYGLTRFLRELKAKWPFFEPLFMEEVGEEQKMQDKQTVKSAENLIKTGNIDEAIQLMKGATA